MHHERPLALHGGDPVRRRLLPYGRQTLLEEDIASVVEVLRSDWITTGPKVDEFEEALAGTVGSSYAVTFNSGTAALHAAVFAAGVGAGDEAITSPLTFCATGNCLLYQNAVPVFADVRSDSLTLDPDAVVARVTRRTKAILPVDYAGHPADLDAYRDIAARHGLVVIEDAAHALGASYRGRPVGSLSHLTTFSFHPVKHVTTGEGGAVTTDDPELARRLRLFRNHGIAAGVREREQAGTWRYDMVELGYNYRLTDIGCALGLSQLRRLSSNVASRRTIAARYEAELTDLPFVRLPTVMPDVEAAWHLYPVRIQPPLDRDEVWRALRAEGIGANVHYEPIYRHTYYRARFAASIGACREAEIAAGQLLSLPMFHGMTSDDVGDVVRAVWKVIAHFAGRATA